MYIQAELSLHVTNDTQSHGGVGLHVLTYKLPEHYQHEAIFFEVNVINCTFVENFVHAIYTGTHMYHNYSVP